MFKLVGTDLPLAKTPQFRVAPTIRVWQGSQRGLGYLARINAYANYLEPSFEIKRFDVPRPIASGFLYKLLPDFAFSTPSVEGFQLLTEIINPLPKMIWVGDGVINLYASTQQQTALLNLTLLTPAPIPLHPIILPSALEVRKVTYQGLVLPFTQTGLTLTYTTDFPIPVGDVIEVLGTYTAQPQFVCYAANFLFPELNYVDRFDYLGVSFAPSPDATNPQPGQFIWSETLKLCTVFSSTLMDAPAANWDYSSTIGVLTY